VATGAVEMPYKDPKKKLEWARRDRGQNPDRYKKWSSESHQRTIRSPERVAEMANRAAARALKAARAKELREYPSLLREVIRIERLKAEAREQRKMCKHCGITKPFGEMVVCKKSTNGVGAFCRLCHNARAVNWRDSNPDNMVASRKRRYGKIKGDPALYISMRIRDRIGKVIKRHGTGLNVSGSRMQYLGCTGQQVKEHLEAQFDDSMTWSNYGTYWHVDHIRPLASYDMNIMADRKHAFHYTNLQPLEAMENMRKGDRWEPCVSHNQTKVINNRLKL
jgi:hypothetical protein